MFVSLSFSDSGWTDREIAVYWLEHLFVPYAEKHRVHTEKPIVLTIDGHDSHETAEFKGIAFKHGIIIHAFPSKTTHKTQPLDVGVFSSVQRAWTKHCDKRLADGVGIDRYNFIHEYMEIHHVITPELVQKAFKKTGLYPLNPSAFGDEDFAPSLASSNTAPVPPSFPPDTASPSFSALDMQATHPTISPTGPGWPVLSLSDAMALSKEELWNEVQHMNQQNITLFAANRMLTSQLEASNTHCTLARQALSQSRLELDNCKKKRPRQSVKTRARWVTMPELQEDFEKAQLERQEKDKLEAEKQAKKKADEDVRQSQIEQDIRGKTFDALSTFRRKDDYITLAGALGISREGTVEELKTRIKHYIADPSHADIALNPRFSALFQTTGKTSARNPSIIHPQVPALSFDTKDSHSSFSAVESPSLQSQASGTHTQSYPQSMSQPQDDVYNPYRQFSTFSYPHTSHFDASQSSNSDSPF